MTEFQFYNKLDPMWIEKDDFKPGSRLDCFVLINSGKRVLSAKSKQEKKIAQGMVQYGKHLVNLCESNILETQVIFPI